jgi:parallel beta helix pectate lyase-like protein
MAFAASSDWYVRSDGASANGGGFDRAASGTNYANQASAQTTYTDLVIDGADNTKITSAAFPFTSLHPGNVINITSGTGFTVQRAQVVSVSGVIATMDKAMGTVGSTGGNGRLGGALDSVALAETVAVAGNKVWIKGSLNVGTAILANVAGTELLPIVWEGYGTTPGDGEQATLLATGTLAGSPIMRWAASYHIVKNLTADGADLALTGFRAQSPVVWFDNCHATRCTTVGLNFTSAAPRCRAVRCKATLCGAALANQAGFLSDGAGTLFRQCVARDNLESGIFTTATAVIEHCLIHDNDLWGIFLGPSSSNGAVIANNTIRGNTLSGIVFNGTNALDATYVVNNLLASNGEYGISSESSSPDYSLVTELSVAFENNAYYNNTLGERNRLPAGVGDITLTADPFIDAAADDFTLNLAIGGGLLARGAGTPGGFGLRSDPEVSVAAIDIGAVVLAGVSAAQSAYGQGWARELWRELTNERDEDVVPDAVVDLYLQRGAEALNDIIRYHRTDGTITLVAGTQEYAAPSDFIECEYVTWQNKDLEKGDIERWREKGIDWRNEPAGPPVEWAVYAQRLVLRPTPNAAAVGAAATIGLRYVSTPVDVSTFGFAQLPNHYHRLAVYYGAALWGGCYPESQRSVLLEQTLMGRFTAEGQAAASDYGARPLGR